MPTQTTELPKEVIERIQSEGRKFYLHEWISMPEKDAFVKGAISEAIKSQQMLEALDWITKIALAVLLKTLLINT